MLNVILGINVAIMLVMSAITSGVNYYFNVTHQNHFYIYQNWVTPSEIALACFFSFWLILNSHIPLDCIVVIEFSKLYYFSVLKNDIEMKTIDPTTGELLEFESHNYNVLEDTAEIEYIFADKTGTLTRNELRYR